MNNCVSVNVLRKHDRTVKIHSLVTLLFTGPLIYVKKVAKTLETPLNLMHSNTT